MKKLVAVYWGITTIGAMMTVATGLMVGFGMAAVAAPHVGLAPYQLQTMLIGAVILILAAIPFMFTRTARLILVASGVYCTGVAGLIATGLAGFISPFVGVSSDILQTMVVVSVILTTPSRLLKLYEGE
jgi:hypothetical protein